MKLPSSYDPKAYETDIYALWEQNDAFKPKHRGNRDYFSIVAPPPNANANLHIGYGLTMAVEDIIVRYHRMTGKATLFVPGADHAGFETQVVYEKELEKQGKSRFDLSREELYKQIWEFVAQNRSTFDAQFRALGASVNWDNFTFTLDDKVVNQVYDTFKKMWHDNLIYRGKRIVNFCTFHGTSFSDIEVVYEEEQTKLWHIAYPLEDGSGELVIATTRPETKLGQSALMVHPKDDRYKQFIGKKVLQPLVPNSTIPVIADEYVDMEFGTGVVTVTPGHDPNDFEVAQRHNLPLIDLITPEGRMSENVPEPFRGLTILEARSAVEKALDDSGHLRGVEDHSHSVGKCYKCGTIIEPLAREQWFVRMEQLAKKAIQALEAKQITFYPDSKRKQLIRYLEGLRDWNISRQIAWGIPIPAFYNADDPKDWIFDARIDKQEIEVKGKKYLRDPDVFDTWFSSGAWPYVTLNYPHGEEYKHFYPTSLLETGGEILYPWVSRMIMLGLYNTGKVPFKTVYIHGYVMAEDGSKMSKSTGNTVDLSEVIATYGSDALRMGIVAGRTPAVNRGYDERKVAEARNFANKLWNVARFVEDKIGDNQHLRVQPSPKSDADHWVLSKLQQSTEVITDHLEKYRLAEAYEALYHFVWDDFADWYVEASKVELNESVLAFVLESTLKLAHPFAPFLTETIWQTLAWEQGSVLAVAPWPKSPKFNSEQAEAFAQVMLIVSEARNIISELQASKPGLYYTNVPFLSRNSELLKQLARLSEVREVRDGRGLFLTKTPYKCWLDIDTQTAMRHLDKLKNQQQQHQSVIDNLNQRLSSGEYTSRAPRTVVDQTKAQLNREQGLLDTIEQQIQTFTASTQDQVEAAE